MADVIKTITGKTGASEKPIFSVGSCINKRQRKYTCTKCIDMCPQNVFSLDPKEPLKWDRCTGCGMCVSVCPARCFAPSAEMQRELTEDIDLDRTVTFSCFEEEQLCDKTVDCLAAIPWELLAVITMHTDIVLYRTHCKDCKSAAKCRQLDDDLGRLKNFLGDAQYAEKVHIVTEGRYIPQKTEETGKDDSEKSRQEILADLKESVKKTFYQAAVKRLPILDPADSDGMQYRRLLSNLVVKKRNNLSAARKAEPNLKIQLPTYGVSLPSFTADCYGCGVCEKICPRKAIDIVPEEGGTKLIYIEPAKCTGCGLCTILCRNNGLAGMQTVQVPYLNRLPLVRVKGASCSKCGCAIRPDAEDGLCPTCLAKSKVKVR